MNFRGFILSLLIHGLGIGGFFIKNGLFPRKTMILKETPACTIPLEVTAISEISCAPISKPKVEAEHNDQDIVPEPVKMDDPEPVPEIKPETIPEPVKMDAPEPVPEIKPETIPEPVKIDDPKPVPEIKPETVLQPVLPEPKKKIEPPKTSPKKLKKAIKEKEKKKKSDLKNKKESNVVKKPKKKKVSKDFISVLKNLEQEDGPSAQTPITDPDSDSEYGAAALGPTMAMSIIDRVRRLLESAWRVPTAAHNGGSLIVTVCMKMNPDGTVRDVVIDHGNGTCNHPAYDVACQSALRAVDRFRDTPLPLPADCYEQWKEFQFRFIRK